jgi:hypothetical protein
MKAYGTHPAIYALVKLQFMGLNEAETTQS